MGSDREKVALFACRLTKQRVEPGDSCRLQIFSYIGKGSLNNVPAFTKILRKIIFPTKKNFELSKSQKKKKYISKCSITISQLFFFF